MEFRHFILEVATQQINSVKHLEGNENQYMYLRLYHLQF